MTVKPRVFRLRAYKLIGGVVYNPPRYIYAPPLLADESHRTVLLTDQQHSEFCFVGNHVGVVENGVITRYLRGFGNLTSCINIEPSRITLRAYTDENHPANLELFTMIDGENIVTLFAGHGYEVEGGGGVLVESNYHLRDWEGNVRSNTILFRIEYI